MTELNLIQVNSFTGPGMFCFEFKECSVKGIYPKTQGMPDLDNIINVLRQFNIPGRGHFKWYEGCYGPIVLDTLSAKDFTPVSGFRSILDEMVDSGARCFTGFEYMNGEPEIIRHKIHALTGFVPDDTTAFFRYTREIRKYNEKSIHLLEHNQYDFFHLLIGYNENTCYLISLFWD
jgi:hypothetical protein